jgi:deazaflavin-dependent oxidoreductase (nitroreductase family)
VTDALDTDATPAGSRPRQSYRPGRWHRLENVVMSALVSAGLVPHSCLLTTRGCRTGRTRRNPVLVIDHDGRRWLVAPYGAVSWVHNARAAGQVQVTRRRITRDHAIREVDGPEAGPVLQRYVQIASATRLYFQADQDDPVENFIAEAGQHPVFELTPITPNSPPLSPDAPRPEWQAP